MGMGSLGDALGFPVAQSRRRGVGNLTFWESLLGFAPFDRRNRSCPYRADSRGSRDLFPLLPAFLFPGTDHSYIYFLAQNCPAYRVSFGVSGIPSDCHIGGCFGNLVTGDCHFDSRVGGDCHSGSPVVADCHYGSPVVDDCHFGSPVVEGHSVDIVGRFFQVPLNPCG